MLKWKRSCSSVVSALALCGVAAAQGTATPKTRPTLETKTVRGGDGKTVTVDFGEIAVPENRSKKGSRDITLAFARARCTLDEPGPPVFVLAGGPGGSSIRMLRGMLRGGGQWFVNRMRGDVVAIDQRGVGKSRPNLETDTKYGFSVTEPGDPVELLAKIRKVCREEAARWRAKGVDLSGYTTTESADDIDAVRRALGYAKITLWGGSYGSHLAMATIRRHEKHIARAVLTGPEGPDHTLKLPSYAQTGLERVAKIVAADPVLGKKIPDLVGMVRTVLERLEKKPAFVEVDGVRVGVSKFDVQQLLANALGNVRGGIVKVPAGVYALANGDFSVVARELMNSRRSAGIWSAMQMVMDSASGVSKERAAQIREEAKQCLLGDAINFPFGHLAESWGAPDLGDEYRGPLRTEIPVLFMVGDLDSRTPIRNAKELMKHMPNAHLIQVANCAHDFNFMQRDLRDPWHRFLGGEAVGITTAAAPAVKFAPLESAGK